MVSTTSFAENSTILSDMQDSLSQTWQSKDYELYIPVNTWHNRSYYTDEKIASYNEQPWGLGTGKYRLDAEGDWHSIYAVAFLDSHSKIEPIVGYGFQKIWRPNDVIRLGLGYTVGVTLREDSNYLYWMDCQILSALHSITLVGKLRLKSLLSQITTTK